MTEIDVLKAARLALYVPHTLDGLLYRDRQGRLQKDDGDGIRRPDLCALLRLAAPFSQPLYDRAILRLHHVVKDADLRNWKTEDIARALDKAAEETMA